MKTILLILFYNSLSAMLYGQGFAVSADKMNIAYVNFDNPMTIVSETYKCDQLIASCDNGTLTKSKDCQYNFHPEKQGVCDIVISAKTKIGTKVIGSVKYRVKFLSGPVARIAGKLEGTIATSVFKAQSGVTAQMGDGNFDFPIHVVSFKIEFYRNGEVLYDGVSIRGSFNEDTRKHMKNLKAGDRVSVTGVRCVSADGRVFPLNDINLTLN